MDCVHGVYIWKALNKHYFIEAPYIYIYINACKQAAISAADFSLAYLVGLLQETEQFVATLGSLPVPDNPVQLC